MDQITKDSEDMHVLVLNLMESDLTCDLSAHPYPEIHTINA